MHVSTIGKLYVPLLDHLIRELESRFNKHKQTALQGMYLIPAPLVTKSIEEVSPVNSTADMVFEVETTGAGARLGFLRYPPTLPHASSLPQYQSTPADSLYIASHLLLSREKFQWIEEDKKHHLDLP